MKFGFLPLALTVFLLSCRQAGTSGDKPIAMPASDIANVFVKSTTIFQTRFQMAHPNAGHTLWVQFGNPTLDEIESITGDLILYDNSGHEVNRIPVTLKMVTAELQFKGRLLPRSAGIGSATVTQQWVPHMGFEIKSATCYQNATDYKDFGHLFSVVTRQDNEKMKAMIPKDPSLLNAKDPDSGATLVHVAAETNNVELLDYLIGKGADYMQRGKIGSPVLLALAAGGNDTSLDLIRRGADLSNPRGGWGPLEIASKFCSAEVIHALINSGCDPNDLPPKLASPLEVAAEAHNPEVALALIKDGAKVNYTDKAHEPPLFHAIKVNDQQMVQLLLDHGAKINEPAGAGYTALMMAAGWTDGDMIQFLLSKGADINAKDPTGKTALDIAKEAKNPSTIQALEQAAKK